MGLLLGLSACGFGPQGSNAKAKPALIKDLLSPAIPVTRVIRSDLPGAGRAAPSFDAVDFISPEVGFASGHRGTTATPILWRTTDGGRTWSTFTPKVPGYAQLLLKLDFTSAEDGYAIMGTSCTMPGDEPTTCAQMSLVETSDGGHTFSTVIAPAPTYLTVPTNLNDLAQAVLTTGVADVEMSGAGSGIAVLPGGFYIDSAGTWTRANVAGTPIAAAWSGSDGILVVETSCDGATPYMEGCTDDVLRTSDGGASFTKTGTITAIPGVARVGMDGALAVLDWQSKPGVAPCAIGCYEPSTLTVDVSTDGGATWTTSTTVKATSESRLGTPLVSAEQGAAWLPREHVDQNLPPTADGVLTSTGLGGANPAWHDLQAQWAVSQLSATSAGIWAVASDSAAGGFLASTTDGANTWQLAPFEMTPQVSVDFVTPQVGYGIGAPGLPGALLRTDDGGMIWSIVRTAGVGSASFWSADDGVLNTAQGPVTTADGGVTTSPVPPLPKGMAVGPIQAGSADTWVAAGSPIWWGTTDGGGSWQRLTPGTGTDYSLVEDYAAAPDGALWVLRTQYGPPHLTVSLSVRATRSSAWRRLWNLGLFYAAYAGVDALGARDAWFALNPAYPNYPGPFFLRLLHTTNGGKAWTEIKFTQGLGVTSLSFGFVNDRDGWILIPQVGLYRTTDAGVHWVKVA